MTSISPPLSSLLNKLFDPQYRAHLNQATREVPLLYALYVLCIPMSKVLIRFGVSPTVITHFSNLLAIIAVAALVWAPNPWWFPALWTLSLFFDIADGIVARATKRSSAVGSFYDHVSDQVKVILLFFGAGLRYDESLIWILSYFAGTTFLLVAVVNQISAHRAFRVSVHRAEPAPAPAPAPVDAHGLRQVLRSYLRRHPRLRSLLWGTYLSIFAMYGNSMLLVLPLSFGREWAVVGSVLFWIVAARSLIVVLRFAHRTNRQLADLGIRWK